MGSPAGDKNVVYLDRVVDPGDEDFNIPSWPAQRNDAWPDCTDERGTSLDILLLVAEAAFVVWLLISVVVVKLWGLLI